jgi:hypothetical protein
MCWEKTGKALRPARSGYICSGEIQEERAVGLQGDSVEPVNAAIPASAGSRWAVEGTDRGVSAGAAEMGLSVDSRGCATGRVGEES